MKWAVFLLTAAALPAQHLRVYSELAQPGAPTEPREILSPALARNAFTSFQVSVEVAKGTHYWLYIGENPEDAARITVYRESGDRLEPVELPYQGDTSQMFWMDVWIDRDAPVRRIKIEPQLNIADDWVVYPMEGRVMEATVPEGSWPEGSGSPLAVMRSFLCETKAEAPAAPGSLSALRFRNAQQDVALAHSASREALRKLLGGCTAAPPEDPEFYLRFRDYLFRMR